MPIGKLAAESRAYADPSTGIIHLDASIFWAAEDIDPILDRLTQLVGSAHAKRAAALVLVHFGASGAQKGDTVERVRQRSTAIYRPGDRLAVVLESQLLKMQIARVDRIADYRVFGSRADAEEWLRSPTKK